MTDPFNFFFLVQKTELKLYNMTQLFDFGIHNLAVCKKLCPVCSGCFLHIWDSRGCLSEELRSCRKSKILLGNHVFVLIFYMISTFYLKVSELFESFRPKVWHVRSHILFSLYYFYQSKSTSEVHISSQIIN